MDIEEIVKKSLIAGRISGLAFSARKYIELALDNLEFEKLEEVAEILKEVQQKVKEIEKLARKL
jgi:hypothetical protein